MEEYINAFEIALINDGIIDNEFIFNLNIDTILGKWSTINRWLFNRIVNISATEADVPHIIDKVIEKYRNTQKISNIPLFIWTIFPNSTANLKALLLEKGFLPFYNLKALVLDPKTYPDNTTILNEKISVKEIFGVDHVRVFNDLFDLQWTTEDIIETHTRWLKILPFQRQFYAYTEDIPIGIALYQSIPATNFVYFYRSFVKEEYRGIGAYSHLLNHRVKEARKENKQILTIANVATSFPMLLKKGFKELFNVDMLKYEFSVAV